MRSCKPMKTLSYLSFESKPVNNSIHFFVGDIRFFEYFST